ncbi:MAG: DUF1499 domain-containing protein [Rhizobiaceae bacterium]|nr:DUF1499 domain-containing protein [Rhizobiaceae bacterium]
MVGLVARRRSKSAYWCRRLAIFAVPYFLLTIFMHRWDYITTNQTMGLLAFGFILLIISILFALYAIVQLWSDGVKGGQAMIVGIFLSFTMLAPYFIYAGLAMKYPALNDISTNLDELPQYGEKTRSLRNARNVPQTNSIEEPYGDDEISAILTTYPKINPRRYPAGPERVLEAVRSIIADRSWAITEIRGLPTVAEENEEPIKQDNADEVAQLESAHLDDILVDAVTSSLIFAFRNDIVIKIVSEEENTLVEMRSASRWGEHDFGSNASIIEKFLADLDQSLLGIAGEG